MKKSKLSLSSLLNLKKLFTKKPKNGIKKDQSEEDKQLINHSGFFSESYYLSHYQDVKSMGIDPLDHYCDKGWKEGRNPGVYFVTNAYLSLHLDVAQSGMNPLVHYLRYGINEGRAAGCKQDPFLVKRNGHRIKVASSKVKQKLFRKKKKDAIYKGSVVGSIESFDNGSVKGWLASEDEHAIPIVKINNFPTQNTGIQLQTSGSHEVFKQVQNIGYVAEVITSVKQSAEVELLSLTEDGISSLARKTFESSWVVPNKYADLENALNISHQDGAVAITVWEGAHNPIGRAKVLYDVITTERPAIIFAYIFSDFGSELWGPLRNSGLNVVLIPYAERYSYQSYIQERCISFDTVWICKHRLHSFELASMISHPETACILDMDDNEDVFVSSKTSELKPYGIFTKNKANYYLSRLTTRSVASVSIQNDYGGKIMRHAREPQFFEKQKTPINETLTAVFIGTIRAHKNIVDLVSAVAAFNRSTSRKIKLAIGGDFNPVSLRQKLNTADTIILDEVANEDLYKTLAQYDIVITGFPDRNNENLEINKLQITSKIGDGLTVGRPVLTPYSPSVTDLQGIPGLFLFTRENFVEQLQQAMAYEGDIALPDEYTLEYSFKTFTALEHEAKQASKANDIFAMEPLFQYQKASVAEANNIVLVWKQHDSGVYGRRIDHIARYYKQKHPDANVTVIEVMSESSITHFANTKQQFDNSTVIINDVLSQKLYHYVMDGVEYRLLPFKGQDGWNSFDEKFRCFLTTENINPGNSVFILFPLHEVFNQIISIISEYKTIVDLVDNQIKWITQPKKRIDGLKQYYDLLAIADAVVSNSPENINYFKKLNFLDHVTPKVIPNWYTLPESVSFERNIRDNEINLIYSGNMNDRIDWELFGNICEALEKHNGYLHIVGSTVRRAEEMQKLLLNKNCVYHGVINEKQLLRLLQHINFAVIPHAEDSISKFMDPIKLKMYKKLGIMSLTTSLPGLPMDEPLLMIAKSKVEFLAQLDKLLADHAQYSTHPFHNQSNDAVGEAYLNVINQLLKSSQASTTLPRHRLL